MTVTVAKTLAGANAGSGTGDESCDRVLSTVVKELSTLETDADIFKVLGCATAMMFFFGVSDEKERDRRMVEWLEHARRTIKSCGPALAKLHAAAEDALACLENEEPAGHA